MCKIANVMKISSSCEDNKPVQMILRSPQFNQNHEKYNNKITDLCKNIKSSKEFM